MEVVSAIGLDKGVVDDPRSQVTNVEFHRKLGRSFVLNQGFDVYCVYPREESKSRKRTAWIVLVQRVRYEGLNSGRVNELVEIEFVVDICRSYASPQVCDVGIKVSVCKYSSRTSVYQLLYSRDFAINRAL